MSWKEKAAPQRWVENFSDSLFRYAIVRVNDRETARDLVQDTLLSGLQNVSSFRGDSAEKTWLFTILKNKIIDHYRRSSTDKIVSFEDLDESFNLGDYFDKEGEWNESARPISWTGSGHDDYGSKEFHEILQRCLVRLTVQCRAVFSMKYLEELESDEICKRLSVSASNYWVIMHRAKLMLRRCIEKNWIES
ncbi:MAG TPA: sigma-70 family RNA polymerase sigma factor [Candidatus Acidoferrales bacterium]|nr:sigma-70 family RNA polymerase sigma factor [Candidatus Acidoferrales bacterium]